jgi:hypothetical protein
MVIGEGEERSPWSCSRWPSSRSRSPERRGHLFASELAPRWPRGRDGTEAEVPAAAVIRGEATWVLAPASLDGIVSRRERGRRVGLPGVAPAAKQAVTRCWPAAQWPASSPRVTRAAAETMLLASCAGRKSPGLPGAQPGFVEARPGLHPGGHRPGGHDCRPALLGWGAVEWLYRALVLLVVACPARW